MKITQKDIIDLILLSKTPSSDSKEGQKRLAEISRDLSENGLEIEGYERVQWTKFDSDNPKTFPPKGKFLYFDGFGISIGIHLQCENKDGFAHVYRKITHWRPLPPPPGKEEVK